MSIAFKEGLKIPPPAMNEVIVASNHDIRQVREFAVITSHQLINVPFYCHHICGCFSCYI